ncbi:MAG: nucleotide exchange factor GrpE [Anaerolineaceae bacterium]|nr:nucleotide exchange factor GrpE [Anaerolineaceae bacterium]
MNQDEIQEDVVPAKEAAEQDAQTPPVHPEEQELHTQIAEAQKKAQDFMEGWQRERAEFANYKRRIERDMKDIRQNAALDVLLALLPVIDDFERAFSNIPDDISGHAWLEGMTLIHRKFLKMLDDQRIEVLDPVGQPFDPNRHEAVGMEDSDTIESGHVVITLQKGYIWGDRVLRSALVKVAP